MTSERIATEKDVKRERFIKMIEIRVNRILKDFDSLAKCANKKNYSYTEGDIKRIFRELDKKSRETKQLFQEKENRQRKFKLE